MFSKSDTWSTFRISMKLLAFSTPVQESVYFKVYGACSVGFCAKAGYRSSKYINTVKMLLSS